MAQDQDGFEPRLGQSRRDSGIVRAAKPQRRLLERVARAGGNPRRLQSVVGVAAPPRSGRFNARGRGAAAVASFPRGSGWSIDRGSGLRVRPRRVTVKARIVKGAGKAGSAVAHLRYLERDGTTRDGERGRAFSTFGDEVDREAFLERGSDDRHQFRFIVAPEDGPAYPDLKPFTRDVMAAVERDLGTTLDWVAVEHHDTGHPHVHVVVRGVTEDGKTLKIAGDYIAHGVRHRASEVLTRDLGPQTEREVTRQLEHEVGAERLTRLDRTLLARAQYGIVDLRVGEDGTEFGRAHQQQLVARARTLERMELAESRAPLRWSLSPMMEDTLRAMGQRDDIIASLAVATRREAPERRMDRTPGLEPAPGLEHTRIADPATMAPIVGRVTARGLVDEMAERRYLVVDGIDGHSHYVAIGDAAGSFPNGSVVRLSRVSIEPRQVDRTVAEVAAANGGRYTVDRHLRHDPTATDRFAEAHVRRLEAIRRASGGVERQRDGAWIIAPDHLDRVRAYEQQRAQRTPVIIETLSAAPIEQQARMNAPTWLDRQLVGDVAHERSSQGFGEEVRKALALRQQWLIEEGLATQDGETMRYQRGMIDTLRRRELLRIAGQLAKETGLAFEETHAGDQVEGVYRRAVQASGGRYALIERSREFTLVPWRDTLEKQLGRSVAGIAGRGDVDWTFGRGRSGPSR